VGRGIALTEVQADCDAVLDLGDVISSAQVRINGITIGTRIAINGITIGTRIAPPWTFDVSGVLCAGINRVEVCVYNTLANHYQTIPTRFRGSPESGLLSDVHIRFYSRINLE